MIRIDTAVIGGGLVGRQAAMETVANGKKTVLITAGYPLDEISYSEFIAAGGLLLLGDKVVEGTIVDGAVTMIRTEKAGEIKADNYVLATGKFYSGGLKADMNNVYEPVFSLDVWYEKDREKWFDYDFTHPQPFLSFGLETDSEGHPFKDSIPVRNLVAKGGILKKQ